MTSQARNILILAGTLCVASAALAFIAFGKLGDNLVYYWSPAELLAQGDKAIGPTIRMGGLVKAGTVHWDEQHTRLSFEVAEDTSPTAPSVKVVSTDLPPQMFREGIGVVVEGTFAANGVFTSTRVMVNHSNEYRAPKPGDHHKDDWKKTLEGAEPTAAREQR
ncbi:MAG: cytochrome c maturation protein CcmE [Myxococcaceae bacterium]|nr:cytochrome c maturation protein CcmE [Myxococcaceae bacterium]